MHNDDESLFSKPNIPVPVYNDFMNNVFAEKKNIAQKLRE